MGYRAFENTKLVREKLAIGLRGHERGQLSREAGDVEMAGSRGFDEPGDEAVEAFAAQITFQNGVIFGGRVDQTVTIGVGVDRQPILGRERALGPYPLRRVVPTVMKDRRLHPLCSVSRPGIAVTW